MSRVLLTGASGDIGKAIQAKFLQEGDEVITPSHQELDLENHHSITHFMNSVSNIDIFVHSAGINFPQLLGELSFENVSKTMQINAFSFFEICSCLLENFKQKKGGAIVGISSIYGLVARQGRLAYVASKYSLKGMAKSLALELGQYNVKVNTLSPGFVDTKLTRQNNSAETIEHFRHKIPLGRLATPEDIASAVYFLCSKENNFITGQDIIVDGGYTIGDFES